MVYYRKQITLRVVSLDQEVMDRDNFISMYGLPSRLEIRKLG